MSVSTLPEWRSPSWVLTDKEESTKWTVENSRNTYFSCVCSHQGQLRFRLSGGYSLLAEALPFSRFPPLALVPEPDVKRQLHLVVRTGAQTGGWKHTRLGLGTVSLLSMPKQVIHPTRKSRDQERGSNILPFMWGNAESDIAKGPDPGASMRSDEEGAR